MRISAQVSLLAFVVAIGSAGTALAHDPGGATFGGQKGGSYNGSIGKQPRPSAGEDPPSAPSSDTEEEAADPPESADPPASSNVPGTTGAGLADSARRLRSSGGLNLTSDGGAVDKPRIINGDKEAIVYAPMVADQQQGMAAQVQRGIPLGTTEKSNDQNTTRYSYSFGIPNLAEITIASNIQMNSRGSGSIGGGINASLFKQNGSLIGVALNSSRKDKDHVHVSAQVQVWNKNVWPTPVENDIAIGQKITFPGNSVANGPIFTYSTVVPVYGVPVTLSVTLGGSIGYNESTLNFGLNQDRQPATAFASYEFNPYANVYGEVSGTVGVPNVSAVSVGGKVTLYEGALHLFASGTSRAEADIRGGVSGATNVCTGIKLLPAHYLNGSVYANFVQEFPGAAQAAAAAHALCSQLENVDPSTIISNVGNAISNVGDTVTQTGADLHNSVTTLAKNAGDFISSGGGLFLSGDSSPIAATCDQITDKVSSALRVHYDYTIFKWPGQQADGRYLALDCNTF